MRLTLRTLLAYLDGILEPKDAEDLGKKVEESEYATGLVHRVRDVMRRLRLGAPNVTDRGPGLDPNTVAEYLDNTLAPDRVTDFEKVCLDSDTHLAEVAASHQILTLVLGEPAEIDEATRQRIYDVKDVSSGTKPPPPPVPSPESGLPTATPSLSLDLEVGDDGGGRKSRPKPTVPEYLREPRRRRRLTTLVGTVAAACVILLTLWLFGVFDSTLVSLGVTKPQEKQVASNAGATNGKVKEPDNSKTQKETQKEAQQEAQKGTPPAKATETEAGKPPAGEQSVEPTNKVPASNAKEAPPTTAIAPPPANAAKEKEVNSPEMPKAAQNPDSGATKPKNLPPPPITSPPTQPPATPPKAADQPPVTPPPKSADDAGKEQAPLPPAEPEPLGRLLSPEQVLLCDHPANGWTRVGANQMLIPQHVLALPTYRPKIGLTSGVTVEMLGGTRLELLASSGKELPGIRVSFGHVVLVPLGKDGTRLRVEFGNHRGTITFVDAKSIAALDVYPLHVRGSNPETEPGQITANLFAAGGAISWEATGDANAAKAQRLEPSQRLPFGVQEAESPVAMKEWPKWITADGTVKESLSPLDRRASPIVAQAIPIDQPARLELLVLATSRPQWEVKWLAMRSLTYVGQFHEMAAALGDVAHKAHWQDYVDALREAVTRDAETAAAVRVALEKQYPSQAADLFRMLWGYSDKQLESGDDGKGGEDAKLVQALNNESLAVRVLSYATLKEITGKGAIYRPEDSAARRQQTARQWRQRLDAKEIRWSKNEPKRRGAIHEKATAPSPRRSE